MWISSDSKLKSGVFWIEQTCIWTASKADHDPDDCALRCLSSNSFLDDAHHWLQTWSGWRPLLLLELLCEVHVTRHYQWSIPTVAERTGLMILKYLIYSNKTQTLQERWNPLQHEGYQRFGRSEAFSFQYKCFIKSEFLKDVMYFTYGQNIYFLI